MEKLQDIANQPIIIEGNPKKDIDYYKKLFDDEWNLTIESRKKQKVLIVGSEFKKLYEESFYDRRNNKRTK